MQRSPYQCKSTLMTKHYVDLCVIIFRVKIKPGKKEK
jgi:hypothetical protein